MLVRLTKAQVPVYLIGSDFYNCLLSGEDEYFFVESSRLAKNFDVDSDTKLCQVLSTLRYWGVHELPDSILNYVLSSNSPGSFEVIRLFASDYLPIAGL